MMNIGDRVAKIDSATWYSTHSDRNINFTNDYDVHDTLQDAEAIAKEVADSKDEDAVIIEENGKYHVYGVDEIRKKFGSGSNKIYGSAQDTYAFVMTDGSDDQTERLAGESDSKTGISWRIRQLKKGDIESIYFPPGDVTWLLAKKLDPQSWGTLMKYFGESDSATQKALAYAFGDPSITNYNSRVADGAQKLLAVTLQKGMLAQSEGKVNAMVDLASHLKLVTKLPGLPAPVKDYINFNVDVLTAVPKNVAKHLRNPIDAPNSARLFFYDYASELMGISMADDFAGSKPLFNHLQDVYR